MIVFSLKYTIKTHVLIILSVIFSIALHSSNPGATVLIEARESEKEEVISFIRNLESKHFSMAGINNFNSSNVLKKFMTKLDPQFVYFTEEDLDLIQTRYSDGLIEAIRSGDISAAFRVFELLQARICERSKWVIKNLNTIDIYNDALSVEIADVRETWPFNEECSDLIWLSRIHNELSLEVLKDCEEGRYSHKKDRQVVLERAILKLKKRYSFIESNARNIPGAEVREKFLTTVANLYDPHSSFISASSMDDLNITMKQSLVGIGTVLVKREGAFMFTKIIPGGPAAKSGQVNVGDQLVGLADGSTEMMDIAGMTLTEVVNIIRGDEDSIINLLIDTKDSAYTHRRTVELVRKQIELSENRIHAKIIDVVNDFEIYQVGLISMPSFYFNKGKGGYLSSSTYDLEKLIVKLDNAGAKGLVLDLRENEGGMIAEAVRIVGLFIPLGPVMQLQDRYGRIHKIHDRNPGLAWQGPLMVLTSGKTASSAEILAGALKSHRRALIVGDSRTYGKGTIQTIGSLGETGSVDTGGRPSSAIRLTVQKWYLPDGKSVQKDGISSDIVIPQAGRRFSRLESDYENAIESDQIDAFNGYDEYAFLKSERLKRFVVSDKLISALRKSSAFRQATMHEFQYYNRINRHQAALKRYEGSGLEMRKKVWKAELRFRKAMDEAYRDLLKSNYYSRDISSHTANGSVSETEHGQRDFDLGSREGLRLMADWLQLLDASATQNVAVR